jgi:photosystem II stability/assembly factor-like uncharacterized protein
MKKLILGFTLIFIGSFTFAQALHDITSPNPANVFAVGTAGVILKSTNGGTNYSSTISGTTNFQSVHALGFHVWAVGDGGAFSMSTNLGTSWQSATIAAGEKLNSVYFIDSLNGYIAGNNGLMLKTNNSGQTWSSVVTGVTHNLNNLKFTDVMNGYLSGENSAILKTTDGGMSWIVLPTPSLSAIRCFDISGSELVAGSSENILYRSTDGGSTWSSIPLKIQSMPGINALAITAPSRYVIVLESGSIWNTTNGGVTFTYAANEFIDELNAIAVQGQRMYTVSRKHMVVLKAGTSGASWTLTPNTTYSVHYILQMGSSGAAYNRVLEYNHQKRGVFYNLVNRQLYRSLNFGANWSIISTLPDSLSQRSTQLLVCAKDSTKMLAGVYRNNQGNFDLTTIYRTSNYGVSWQQVLNLNMDYIGDYMNQDPQHPDTVYIGSKDSVFRSTNFGATWTKICEAPFLDWCDIEVHPTNSDILYGSAGHYPAKLYKSTNAGANWFFVDFVLDTLYSEMPAIGTSKFNPNLVLHAQYSSVVGQSGLKRSYSAGNTWLYNQFPGASWSIDIAKDDPALFAYGSVSYDPIFFSSNSGSSFIGLSNIYAEQILYYDRSNLYINNHGSIYKMRVIYNMPVIGIQNISGEVPVEYSLKQNYPNPFNPETHIEFNIPKDGFVKLVIYDALGRESETLVNEEMYAGKFRVNWNASTLSSGIYFYRFTAGSYTETRKMVLVR